MVKQKNEYKMISAVRMMGLSHWELLKVQCLMWLCRGWSQVPQPPWPWVSRAQQSPGPGMLSALPRDAGLRAGQGWGRAVLLWELWELPQEQLQPCLQLAPSLLGDQKINWEQQQRDEAPMELVLASSSLSSTAANTSFTTAAFTMEKPPQLEAPSVAQKKGNSPLKTLSKWKNQVLSSLNSIINILQRLNPQQDTKPPCNSLSRELEEVLRTRLWIFSIF